MPRGTDDDSDPPPDPTPGTGGRPLDPRTGRGPAADVQIELGPETEGPAGWTYPATVFAHGRVFRCRLGLSYSDYDLWCRGQHAPHRVAEAALRYLLDREPPDRLPPRLDCATLRRTCPGLDAELPGRIRR